MKDAIDFLSHFSGFPTEQWLGIIALAAITVVGGALYVVHTIVKTYSK